MANSRVHSVDYIGSLSGSALPRIQVGDGGGAGFCRFPAWVKVKSNGVSLGHAIVKLVLVPKGHLSPGSTLLQVALSGLPR